ncbi:MAG TPA: immunoglobulin domain-containing protein [Clostridia bacterium]|nr:immunoglobulin domain-containing protein [Clostridia bacterium]
MRQNRNFAECLRDAWLLLGLWMILSGVEAAIAQETQVGGIARDFEVIKHGTGEPLRLRDYAGNIIALNFWAYWCAASDEAAGEIEANINQYYQARGGTHARIPVVVLNLSIDGSYPAGEERFIQENGLELVAEDYSRAAYNQFKNGYIPHIVVINGTDNSTNHWPWEVLYSDYSYDFSAITNAIESVEITTVPVLPSIITQPSSRIILAGGNVSFFAQARAVPSPSFQWLFNHNPLLNETNSTLCLYNLTAANTGQYTVRVSNSAGAVTSQVAQLTVLVHPKTPGALDASFTLGSGFLNWTNYQHFFVDSISLQPDGKVLVGGLFNSDLDGRLCSSIARFNPDGTLDKTFNPGQGADNVIYTTALQSDGKVLVGGWFNWVYDFNEFCRVHIARLNRDGSLDVGFNPRFEGGPVNRLLVQPDGSILAGGNFNTITAANRPRIAKLKPDGTLDTTFNPGVGPDGPVYTMALQPDGKILVGGGFSAFSGVACKGVVLLTTNGAVDPGFRAALTDCTGINSIAVQPDGRILLGGYFNCQARGNSCFGIARLNPDGSIEETFNPGTGANNTVCQILLQPDGKIILGGYFSSFNGMLADRLARLNRDGSVDSGFGSSLQIRKLAPTDTDSVVFALALQPNGEVLIGGRFEEINGVFRSGFARLHGDLAGRPLLFGAQRLSRGAFGFSLAGQPGKNYLLRTSFDGVTWSNWGTSLCTNVVMSYIDEQADQHPQRFYQALEQ